MDTKPRFELGDIVQHVIDGDPGVVCTRMVNIDSGYKYYFVNFGAGKRRLMFEECCMEVSSTKKIVSADA